MTAPTVTIPRVPPTTAQPPDLVTHALELFGQRLTIHNFASDQLINQTLATYRYWEPWQFNLISRVVGPRATCVDVGANIGINAMFMALRATRGRVIAFEPFEVIFDVLKKNLAANRLARVEPVNEGVSDARRTLRMVTHPNSLGGAHIEQGDPTEADAVTADCRFAPLDDLLASRGIRKADFLKIDVEGHELSVLAGAGRTLANTRLQLVVEFNPAQLRRATSLTAPFPDRRLFSLLRKQFRHLFYMNRDCTMYEIGSFHELRRKLMGGYFVDDLYCTNRISKRISDLISTSPALAKELPIGRHEIGGLMIESVNRDPDGWGLGNAFTPPAMNMTVHGTPGVSRTLTLKFSQLHRKHLNRPDLVSWPVWVLINDDAFAFDLMDKSAELTIETRESATEITIQSEHQTAAASYLGNPNDPRLIGFRVDMEVRL